MTRVFHGRASMQARYSKFDNTYLQVDLAASANNLYNHDEHAFDIDAPPIIPENDVEGGNGDPDDSFMGGVEMDINDDNVAEGDMVLLKVFVVAALIPTVGIYGFLAPVYRVDF